jgi:CelD/BcsL family acetyltransferase involved in cellulose biosynthesis
MIADMNVVYRADRDRSHVGDPGVARDHSLARIDVLTSLVEAEPVWRRLERENACLTAYQRYDFLASWQRHAGAEQGVVPTIVAGFDATGAPLFLWPLGALRWGPLRIGRFLGGKHVNFNFALWRRDYLQRIDAAEMRQILGSLASSGPGIDCLLLRQQPMTWDGLTNPFALLGHARSANQALRMPLRPGGTDVVDEALGRETRSKLRQKERRLQKLPGYRYLVPANAADTDRILDFFFAVKPARMAAQGLPNVFAEPGVQAFLREACRLGVTAGGPAQLRALEAEGEIIAVYAGVRDARRFSSMFNTYKPEHARHSPAVVLLRQLIAELADNGVANFDLGVGEADYKSNFCKDPEPLFDSVLPLTPQGWPLACTARAAHDLKLRIKNSPALWSAAQQVRRWLIVARSD